MDFLGKKEIMPPSFKAWDGDKKTGAPIIGGGNHRAGKPGKAFAALGTFAKPYFPEAKEEYAWANQNRLSPGCACKGNRLGHSRDVPCYGFRFHAYGQPMDNPAARGSYVE